MRAVASVLGGAVLALAFPPFETHLPLAPVAVAILTVTVHRAGARTGAWCGGLFGLVFFLVLLDWMRVIGPDAWVGLSVVCALFLAALGAATAVVTRLPFWPVWVGALWVTAEAARDRVPFGGFPWGRLAFGDELFLVTPLAALGGAPLVTFATALAGALVAWLVLERRGSRPRLAAVAAALVALPAAAALIPLPTDGRPVQVALVQGNVPRAGLDFLGQQRAVLNNHVGATRQLADDVAAGRVPQPDLVIWPENSTDIDPLRDASAREQVDGAVRAVGAPTLVGAVLDGPDGGRTALNAGVVWDPVDGPGDRYVKRHLVPWGEYVPFRDQLERRISRLQRVGRDFAPGTEPGVLQVGPVVVADVICFEVAYDEVVRDAVRGGGEVIVVQTNNATYGRTGQPQQQAVMSRLRAVEHGRPVLVASTSGVSQVVDADGTVRQRTEEFEQRVLSAEVHVRTARTLAARVGAAPEWLLTIVGVTAALIAVVRRRPLPTPTTETA